jgi:cyclopropane fatty-acyl-phospholipid synthase-like methyltransferase
MDASELKEISDASVDVVFEKGMLDSILAGTTVMNENTKRDIDTKARRYIEASYRVLKPDGFLFLMTFCHELDVYPKFDIKISKSSRVNQNERWSATKISEKGKVPLIFKINKR